MPEKMTTVIRSLAATDGLDRHSAHAGGEVEPAAVSARAGDDAHEDGEPRIAAEQLAAVGGHAHVGAQRAGRLLERPVPDRPAGTVSAATPIEADQAAGGRFED